MGKVIIAGNWKMYTDINEACKLADELVNGFNNKNNVEVVICPPFTNLFEVKKVTKDSSIKLGAQNMYPEEKGAYTGEISPLMIKSAGCSYVIIGHSERREYFKESNDFLNKKIKCALNFGLTPIYCVGEKLEEREANKTFKVLETQLKEGLEGFAADELKKIVIAYEPVWAIGTGKTASPAQAEEVHAFIRDQLSVLSDKGTAQAITIQYGGSVKPDNVTELMKQPNIDGALVGGASLKADSFLSIINF
ncbi:MAG: triose-phosphate isomerase [Candidatus Margulisbacteria bacterium]|nr:triose-phosphate isomerase [Candidatus Margulisiibacteriota bacterium]